MPRLLLKKNQLALAAALMLAITLLQGVQRSASADSAEAANASQASAITKDIRFRSEVGLPTNEGYVRALYDRVAQGANGFDRSYGVLLTEAEASLLHERDEQASANAAAVRSYFGESSPVLGGMYFDHQGDAFVVLVTSDLERVSAELRSAVPYPGQLRVAPARHALVELSVLVERVSHDIAALEADGVVVTGVSTDHIANLVEVNVEQLTPGVRGVIQRRYPGAPIKMSEASRPTTTGERNQDAPPFRGAQYIHNVVQYACSNGFVARKAGVIGNQYFVVTAGHCGISTWAQNAFPEGRSEVNTFYTGSLADSMRIPIGIGNMSREVFITINSYRIITAQEGYKADYVNKTVCISGFQTEISCGLITRVDRTVPYVDSETGQATTLYLQREATSDNILGDSGGSVFHNNLAMGIISGQATYPGNDIRTIYSHIAEVMPYQGLVTATTCEGGVTPACR